MSTTEECEELLQKQRERKAVDDLAEMLCGGRKIPKEILDCTPEDCKGAAIDANALNAELVTAEEIHGHGITADDIAADKTAEHAETIKIGNVRMKKTEGGIAILPAQEHDCRRLDLHNKAIDALTQLLDDGIDSDVCTDSARELLDMLKEVRMNTFEHMIPWEKIAGARI